MGSTREYALQLPNADVRFDVSASSDKGLVRRLNEDSFVASPPVFLVADGMGGHAHGDRASQEAARVLGSLTPIDSPVTPSALLDAIADANLAVQAIAGEEFAGTTLAGIALAAESSADSYHWMAFNVGDSRIYRWEHGVLTQVSVDHSAVQELVDDGQITQDEAAVHPDRNVITRAIGIPGDLAPDVWLMPAAGNQSFLLCSDGLTKELDDASIAAVLSSAAEPTTSAADRLVAAALASGGADNVTVVFVESRISPVGSLDMSATEPVLPAHLEETLPRP